MTHYVKVNKCALLQKSMSTLMIAPMIIQLPVMNHLIQLSFLWYFGDIAELQLIAAYSVCLFVLKNLCNLYISPNLPIYRKLHYNYYIVKITRLTRIKKGTSYIKN